MTLHQNIICWVLHIIYNTVSLFHFTALQSAAMLCVVDVNVCREAVYCITVVTVAAVVKSQYCIMHLLYLMGAFFYSVRAI